MDHSITDSTIANEISLLSNNSTERIDLMRLFEMIKPKVKFIIDNDIIVTERHIQKEIIELIHSLGSVSLLQIGPKLNYKTDVTHIALDLVQEKKLKLIGSNIFSNEFISKLMTNFKSHIDAKGFLNLISYAKQTEIPLEIIVDWAKNFSLIIENEWACTPSYQSESSLLTLERLNTTKTEASINIDTTLNDLNIPLAFLDRMI